MSVRSLPRVAADRSEFRAAQGQSSIRAAVGERSVVYGRWSSGRESRAPDDSETSATHDSSTATRDPSTHTTIDHRPLTINPHLSTALADHYRLERELGQRWHGHGLPGPGPPAPSEGGGEGAAAGAGGQAWAPIGSPGDPDRRPTPPSPHPGAHRFREAGGLLYYVMPFVAGESLRDRRSRGGAAGGERSDHSEVADALADAQGGRGPPGHQAGKHPVAGRHALVRDFGVAKAVSEARAGKTHRDRHHRRHAGLHGAGTGRRRSQSITGPNLRPRHHGV